MESSFTPFDTVSNIDGVSMNARHKFHGSLREKGIYTTAKDIYASRAFTAVCCVASHVSTTITGPIKLQ